MDEVWSRKKQEDNWELLWVKGFLPLFSRLYSRNISVWGCLLVLQVLFLYSKGSKVLPLPWRDAQAHQSEPRTLSRGSERLVHKGPSSLLFLSVTPRIHSSHPKHTPDILPTGCSWSWWCSALSAQLTKILHLFFQRSPWKILILQAGAHEQDLLGNLRKGRVHMARRRAGCSAWLAEKDKVPPWV